MGAYPLYVKTTYGSEMISNSTHPVPTFKDGGSSFGIVPTPLNYTEAIES